MEQDKHDMKPAVSARRRLIRGAFAAPAAMTLYSGSVSARSIVNCVTRQASSPDVTPTPSNGTDGYVRVRLQKFQRNVGSSTNNWSRWVRGFDVSSLQVTGGPTVFVSGTAATNTSWFLFDRGSASNYISITPGSGSGIIGSTPSENTTTPARTTTQTDDQWVALRVSATGNIVGVVGINNTANTTAVSQSCWTSFRIG